VNLHVDEEEKVMHPTVVIDPTRTWGHHAGAIL
jgi:hypothetical protein